MASMRVHELAKEFDMTSKELLDWLHEMKIPAKSHASMLADAYVDKIRKNLSPEIKQRAEQLYASYGLNLTDAINIFIQQSLNMEGLPFLLSPENEEYMQAKALKRLMTELDAGWKSAEQGRWVSEEEAMRRLELDA